MDEAFLHYIWRFQHFNKMGIETTSGEPLDIIKPGFLNEDQGPDFQEAKVRIGDIEWAGHIEIHVNASDWLKHGHNTGRPNYENVILHVVWDYDKPILRKDGSVLPTLELKGRVQRLYLERFNSLMGSESAILCERHLDGIPDILWTNTVEKMLVERLHFKSERILDLLRKNKGDWGATALQILISSFGFKKNQEAFAELGARVPQKILMKYAGSLPDLEAILFGVAGLLHGPKDEYHKGLADEYTFKAKKYELGQIEMDAGQWKYARLRPQNFPTLRLAQLASFLHHNQHYFNLLIGPDQDNLNKYVQQFMVPPSEYWQSHYQFGEIKQGYGARLGRGSAEILVINVSVPLLAAYSTYTDEEAYLEKGLQILQNVTKENNSIIKKWELIGAKVKNAFDSQGLLHLYNTYCLKKRCLNCNIGVAIINKT